MFLLHHISRLVGMLFVAETVAYGNLKELTRLVRLQENQLLNPFDSGISNEIKVYNICIKMFQKSENALNIFAPRYFFGIQDFEYDLECLCNPNGYTVKWTQVTFESTVNVVSEGDGIKQSSRLVLNKAKPQLTIYYCSWKFKDKDIINNIWLVEIVPADILDKVPSVSWTEPEPYYSSLNIMISNRWEPWSMCNKCKKAGKRHRFGYCIANNMGEKAELDILNLMGSISCSALVRYHPEILPTDEAILTNDLMISTKMMVGYCKVPCVHYGLDFEKSAPLAVRLIYKDSFPLRSFDTHYNNKAKHFSKWFTLSKLPDILLLMFVVGLQLWIIIHIIKNRKHAE